MTNLLIVRHDAGHVGCSNPKTGESWCECSCKTCGKTGASIRRFFWSHRAVSIGGEYWAAGCGCPKWDNTRGCVDHPWEKFCPAHAPDLFRPALQRTFGLEAA